MCVQGVDIFTGREGGIRVRMERATGYVSGLMSVNETTLSGRDFGGGDGDGWLIRFFWVCMCGLFCLGNRDGSGHRIRAEVNP